jgi:hypothetical protein
MRRLRQSDGDGRAPAFGGQAGSKAPSITREIAHLEEGRILGG